MNRLTGSCFWISIVVVPVVYGALVPSHILLDAGVLHQELFWTAVVVDALQFLLLIRHGARTVLSEWCPRPQAGHTWHPSFAMIRVLRHTRAS